MVERPSRGIGKKTRIALAGLAVFGITVEAAGAVITQNINWPLTLAGNVPHQKTPETSSIGWEHRPPQGYASDFANLLVNEDKIAIDTQLAKLQEDTTAEVAVVTVDNLNGDSIEDYAVKLIEDWKIGKKSKDNGLLFLVVKDEKKVRIEVGYGLEPYLVDSQAGRILDQVAPYLNSGDYANGIKTGVNAIDACIRDGYARDDVCRTIR